MLVSVGGFRCWFLLLASVGPGPYHIIVCVYVCVCINVCVFVCVCVCIACIIEMIHAIHAGGGLNPPAPPENLQETKKP